MKTSSPHNQNLFNTTNADNTDARLPREPLTPARPCLLNKSGGGKGRLVRTDIHSKDPEHVTHLQTMPVTLGCDPGTYDPDTYGPDKDGVDWPFGSFNETAEMISRKRTGTERNLSIIWEFSNLFCFQL